MKFTKISTINEQWFRNGLRNDRFLEMDTDMGSESFSFLKTRAREPPCQGASELRISGQFSLRKSLVFYLCCASLFFT